MLSKPIKPMEKLLAKRGRIAKIAYIRGIKNNRGSFTK